MVGAGRQAGEAVAAISQRAGGGHQGVGHAVVQLDRHVADARFVATLLAVAVGVFPDEVAQAGCRRRTDSYPVVLNLSIRSSPGGREVSVGAEAEAGIGIPALRVRWGEEAQAVEAVAYRLIGEYLLARIAPVSVAVKVDPRIKQAANARSARHSDVDCRCIAALNRAGEDDAVFVV